MGTKSWYLSKTLWLNVLAVLGVIAEYLITKQVYSPELHVMVLAVINIVLRAITKSGLVK